MCQARPGLRCTSHASQNLSYARESLKHAMQEWDAIKNARSSEKKISKLESLESAQEKVHQAEKDYYASAGGLKELRASLTSQELNDTERAQIQAQIELAEYDQASQKLAYALYQGRKHNVSSAMRTQYEILKNEEQAQADNLARALNSKSPDLTREKLKMRHATARKLSHEERMRLKAADISSDNVGYAYMRDIAPQRKNHDIYIPLRGEDFGRARDYFPYGAYGKVTDIKRDNSGALNIKIEDKIWKKITGYNKVMHVPRDS